MNPEDLEMLHERRETDRFSKAIPRSVGSPGLGRIAVIVARDGRHQHVTHLGFVRAVGTVSTFDLRISVERLTALSPAVGFEGVRTRMKGVHFGALLSRTAGAGGDLTDAASKDLRSALEAEVSADVWESLVPRSARGLTGPIEILNTQYDALATGFAIAGIEPSALRDRTFEAERSVLEIIRADPGETDLTTLDFLKFADRTSIAVTEHIRRFEHQGRRLDVINLNAKKQEAALGVDLLYFNYDFSSFIGVQYKLADATGSQLSRVDDRLISQIDRMLKVEELGVPAKTLTDHRLGVPAGMYLKFARPAEVRSQSTEMSKGWYVPAAYAKAMIDSGLVAGPRKGKVFTLRNLRRWLTNDEFTSLGSNGWIGSVGVQPQALDEYIENSLAESRSVMVMRGSRR